MKSLNQALRVAVVTIALVGCASEDPVSNEELPRNKMQIQVADGVCLAGGDTLGGAATWNTEQCNLVNSFSGQTFTTTMQMPPRAFQPQNVNTTDWKATSFVHAEYHYYGGQISYVPGLSASLTPNVRALRFVGFVGWCPKTVSGYSLSQAECGVWAFANTGYSHDEAYLCVANPNIGVQVACEPLMSSGNLAQTIDASAQAPQAAFTATRTPTSCPAGYASGALCETVDFDARASQGAGALTFTWRTSPSESPFHVSQSRRWSHTGYAFATPSCSPGGTCPMFYLQVTDQLGRVSTASQ